MPDNNNENPLWLPKGSVRAIMALGVIGTACFIAVLAIKTGTQIQVPEFLIALGSAIAGYYYGKKD